MTAAQPMQAKPGLQGVGGWLLFFCVWLTILFPAVTVYNLTQSSADVRSLVKRYPVLNTLLQGDMVVSILITGLAVYAGIALWRVRPGAVRLARTFLIVGMIYTIIAPFTPLFADLPQRANDAVMNAAFVTIARGLLPYFLWLSYLSSSKRVALTYSSQPTPVYQAPPYAGGPIVHG